MSGRTVTIEERRARLGARHRLATAARSVEELVDDLVVLHATDPATVYLSVGPRLEEASVESVDDALFERRTMLRTLAMRRTLFVVTTTGAAA
ncbi:MAG: crosslink repair DNA glycosylase YcaQ family protein, partial [Acidimicrobiales bacterium]